MSEKKEKLIQDFKQDLKDMTKNLENYEKLYFDDLTAKQRLALLSAKNYLNYILDSENYVKLDQKMEQTIERFRSEI
jgi:hypothetical protein